MIGGFIKKIIGSKNERELKRMRPIVEMINSLEPQMAALSDQQLRAKTTEFKERLAGDVLIPVQGDHAGDGLAPAKRRAGLV